jgi:hypothetical protein
MFFNHKEDLVMNSIKRPVTQVATLVPEPFEVLDAAVNCWLRSQIAVLESSILIDVFRVSMSCGSSYYTLNYYKKSLCDISLQAIDQQHTVMQYSVFQDVSTDRLYNQLAMFWRWFTQLRLYASRLPSIDELENTTQPLDLKELIAGLPKPKRRGPTPAPLTMWVREQVKKGYSIDELLPEYMKRRGEDYVDEAVRRRAREALRKTIEREPRGREIPDKFPSLWDRFD